jgi:hypothetical protein
MRNDDDILGRALGSLRSDAREMRFGGKPLLTLTISAGDESGEELMGEAPDDTGLPSAEGDACAECGMSGGEHSEDCVHCEY